MPNSTVDSQSLESGFPVWTLPLTGCVDSALLILRVSYSKWALLQFATVRGDGLWSGTFREEWNKREALLPFAISRGRPSSPLLQLLLLGSFSKQHSLSFCLKWK